MNPAILIIDDDEKLHMWAGDRLVVLNNPYLFVWKDGDLRQLVQVGGVKPDLAVAPDGRSVATVGDYGCTAWDLETGSSRGCRLFGIQRCVTYTPDGKRLVTGTEFQNLHVVDASDPERERPSPRCSV